MPTMRMLGWCLVLLAVGLAGGCAASGKRAPAAPVEISDAEFRIFDGQTGTERTWEELAAAAASADVVIIGESHTPDAAQVLHARLFQALLGGPAGSSAAAALEFYERDHQADVDDFLQGVITRDDLTSRALGSPQSDLPGHRAILEAAKGARRPVIAANAPRRYATLARREGYPRLESLTAAQRALFAVPPGGEAGLPGGRYRDDFFSFMRPAAKAGAAPPSAEDDARIAATYRAQLLWDATMADSVARGLESGLRPVLLVIGRFHSDFRGGVVQMLAARAPAARVLTTSVFPINDVQLRDEDRGRADWVIFAVPRASVGK